MANDKQKTGQGLITEVSDLQTHSSGRQFLIVNLGPKEKYSCWEAELLDRFKVGASIQFQYTTSKDGKYHNIVSLESDGNGSRAGADKDEPTEKEKRIVKQACIKAASPLVGVEADTPADKAAEAITIAELFVAWVWEKKTTEPPPPEED